MRVFAGRGGYGQWGFGVSFTPARGRYVRIGWSFALAFGPWIVTVRGED